MNTVIYTRKFFLILYRIHEKYSFFVESFDQNYIKKRYLTNANEDKMNKNIEMTFFWIEANFAFYMI